MKLPPGFIDEIKSRLPLSTLVGKRVSFDPARSMPARRDYWGCCPFHKEDTPSFHVLDGQGYYKCFGCGASGDHVKFVQELEGLDFLGAVEFLAREAGLSMPAPDPAEQQRYAKRDRLRGASALAKAFFARALASSAGAEARDYLARRGIEPSWIDAFGLGFAPRDHGPVLLKAAEAEGLAFSDLFEAGLFSRSSTARDPFGFFSGRVIFPIEDGQGRPVAFGGRSLDQGAKAKYLNSPETPIFLKRQMLYNLPRARRAAHQPGTPLLVVEGYTDVIALVMAGFEAAVAPLGTAFTGDHLQEVWKLSGEPLLCFDGDTAGQRAAATVANLALPHVRGGKTISFLALPAGQDPDDLLKAGGKEAFKAQIDQAKPLVDFLFDREAAQRPLTTPEAQHNLEERLKALVATIEDPAVARYYRDAFYARRRSDTAKGPAKTKPARGKAWRPDPVSGPLRTETKGWRGGDREIMICAALVQRPSLLDRFNEDLAALSFTAPDLDKCRAAILNAYAHLEVLDRAALADHLTQWGCGHLLGALTAEIPQIDLSEAPDDAIFPWFGELIGRKSMMAALRREASEAMKQFTANPTPETQARLLAIRAELARAALEGNQGAPDVEDSTNQDETETAQHGHPV